MSNNESSMTFIEHLGELRVRIIRAGIVLIVSVLVCYIYAEPIYDVIRRPLQPLEERIALSEAEGGDIEGIPAQGGEEGAGERGRDADWVILHPLEWILMKIKLAGYGGILLCLPYLMYEVAAFVFPGLKPREKKAVLILLVGCTVLAVVGVSTAYFGIMPMVLPYIMAWTPENVTIQLRMNETMSLILKLYMGFAVAFQFPMVVQVLVFMGLLTPATLRKFRRVAIVGIAFLSALLTPPDPPSMILMGLPLVLLYEVSIWCSYIVIKCKGGTTEDNA